MVALNVDSKEGTRGEVGANEVNAVTSVIEMSIINECASGVDLPAESMLVKGKEGEEGHELEAVGGTGEEDPSISASLHAIIVCEGAECPGVSSEEHGMHETNGAVPLDADETRRSEIAGGYYRTVKCALDEVHAITLN